jgi:hypothetical protein
MAALKGRASLQHAPLLRKGLRQHCPLWHVTVAVAVAIGAAVASQQFRTSGVLDNVSHGLGDVGDVAAVDSTHGHAPRVRHVDVVPRAQQQNLWRRQPSVAEHAALLAAAMVMQQWWSCCVAGAGRGCSGGNGGSGSAEIAAAPVAAMRAAAMGVSRQRQQRLQ